MAQAIASAEMERMVAKLQADHIAANVPADADFMGLLRRDVASYLRANGMERPTLTLELLRRGPTQSGVSYPKYYIWIRGAGPNSSTIEGAMRVEAVERLRFVVTDFALANAIHAHTADLSSTFPAMLIPSIERRAQAR
jgi:hypothetical protein